MSDDASHEPWAPVGCWEVKSHMVMRKAASGDIWALQGLLLIPGFKSQKEEWVIACRKVVMIFIHHEGLKLH